MAIKLSADGIQVRNNSVEMIGLSTDAKPLDLGDGSTFMELDTGKVFMLLEKNWYEI